MDLLEKIFEAGVVGAGGAGFPTHVKLNCKVDYLIINGSECEPLLKTDQYLMKTKAKDIIETIEEIARLVGAKKIIIGLKKKYERQIDSLKEAIKDSESSVELHLMDNFYPAGDEQILVYEITKKVIPPSGIPLEVGAVVSNIETVVNIHRAMNDKPVIDRHVSVIGMVKEPTILKVPIGTLITKCIHEAGGALLDDYSIILGGPMMGKIFDREEINEMVITKTTGAIIILPKDHYIINRSKTSIEHILNRAASACIQCSYCTDFCPRHLIGHPLKPHKIMRAVAFSDFNDSVKTAQLCCECGVCELYACPMGLSPKTVNIYLKEMMRKKGIKYVNEPTEVLALEERDYRKIPVNRLVSRLELNEFAHQHVNDLKEVKVSEVSVSLKQHIGTPASPVVSVGDIVEKGQLIGAIKEGELGANVHASIDGKVIEVSNKITIKSESFEVSE